MGAGGVQKSLWKNVFEMLGAHIKSCHLKDVLLKQEFILQLEETACGQGGLNLKKYRELIDRDRPGYTSDHRTPGKRSGIFREPWLYKEYL